MTPRFRHGQYGGIAAFVAQMRGHCPDQDPGGTDAYDRPSTAEQIGDVCARLSKMKGRIRAAQSMSVYIGIDMRGKALCQRKASFRKTDDNWPFCQLLFQLIHGSSPL